MSSVQERSDACYELQESEIEDLKKQNAELKVKNMALEERKTAP